MRDSLSKRSKWQYPVGTAKEETIKTNLSTYLMNNDIYKVIERPQNLAKIYNNKWGIIPDFAIINTKTKKIAFFEVKRQGINGNAHERACKYFAPGLQDIFREIAGFDRPIFTIYMNGLTSDPKKVIEIQTWYNDPLWQDRYLLWKTKNIQNILDYWENIVKGYLE